MLSLQIVVKKVCPRYCLLLLAAYLLVRVTFLVVVKKK